MTTTSTGLQAYNDHHSSLNDITAPHAVSAMTATKTATMTQIPATTTAIMKVTLFKFDKCFLHPAKITANNATIKVKVFASCPIQLSNFDCKNSHAKSHAQQL
jgi:hypothetical protein